MRIIVISFQKFTWSVRGVEKKRRDTYSGLNFRLGAHVLDIKWRRKIHPLDIADASNFITFHNSFIHPNCVLKPQVSLYCMTKTEAVFIEVDGELKLNASETLYDAQFKQAKRLIIMPLGVFHKVAQDLGDPRVPVVMISSTGRCGATLLSRVFVNCPGTMLLAEPDCLTTLAFLRKSSALSATEYNNILQSAIRLLCKPDDRTGMVVIRTRPCCCVQIRDVQNLLPRIRHIFIYRNSLRTVSSYISTMANDTSSQCARFVIDNPFLSTVFPCIRKLLYHYLVSVLDHDPPVANPSSLSSVGLFTSIWASCLAQAVECTEKNIQLISILYDEMMKNPWRSVTVLFEKLRINTQYTAVAVEAFKIDASKSAEVSQTLINNDCRKTIAPEMREEADGILRKYGFPKLGERFELNGLVKFDPPPFSKTMSRDKFIY